MIDYHKPHDDEQLSYWSRFLLCCVIPNILLYAVSIPLVMANLEEIGPNVDNGTASG